ncbi:DUF6377 domain-containing protein [Prevotella sp. P6B4]|uniref:DUF6377 domain-containing protein n=1 Tax=Prevotella sp. P6B4 TaxID=1410614 RepID=UPI0006858AED|nr:DUF6377 domain-containing protein [Prevotella sp. P6B4]
MIIIDVSVCWSAEINLAMLYRQLDAAIDSSAYYQKQKSDVIRTLNRQYDSARNDQEQYQFAFSLYREYATFVNDSAIHYLQVCMDCADRLGRQDLKTQSQLAMACQLADTGFYPEAEYHFKAIDVSQLTQDMMITYLSGRKDLYGEMGYYSHEKRLSSQFFKRADVIRDSLFNLLPPESAEYVGLRSQVLNNQNQLDEALAYSDKWLQLVKPNTRQYAIMAFYRSEIYKKKAVNSGLQSNVELQQYWLIRSALTDIRLAIMDQGALWSLANSLVEYDGDLDRAYRYMDFSWNCISQFSTHMRSWQVSPILTRINDQYKNSLHQANTNLRFTVVAISLLLIGLLILLLYVQKKRKQLAIARNELKTANDELALLNAQLSERNTDLSEANRQLNDSNRVKDVYIGKFLSICSEYIDKLDNYRIKINRKLKAGQQNDLLRMTNSNQLKEDELKELFDNFDDVFLRLFPTFIRDFNALLRPGEEIYPTGNNRLNTDLRIFALIRLGIDESSRIAEFLRYSPNSIYSYRTRIKNKAAGNRDDFERLVKEIGIEG